MLDTAATPNIRPQQSSHLRLRRDAIQTAIILAVATVAVSFGYAVHRGLAAHGIGFSLDYLAQQAGFNISEGKTVIWDQVVPSLVDFNSDNSNAQALVAGLFNTIKISVIAIVASTILGTLVGVGRLSSNWVIKQACFGLVEFVRNTPLLIQLVFWYFAVVLQLPPLSPASHLYAGMLATQQGTFIPSIVASSHVSLVTTGPFVLCLLLAAASLKFWTTKGTRYGLLGTSLACLALSVVNGFPLAIEYPTLNKFSADGGLAVSPEMAALLLALVTYTAGFIAEIVRGAIETLAKGQWEAAAALGLSKFDTLRDVVLPQVYRVVLPAFGNQYISLMKNSSLGIAIGYPDLFNVYGTIANQTGRTLEGVIIVMITYLLMSWAVSGLVNLGNRQMLKRGAGR